METKPHSAITPTPPASPIRQELPQQISAPPAARGHKARESFAEQPKTLQNLSTQDAEKLLQTQLINQPSLANLKSALEAVSNGNASQAHHDLSRDAWGKAEALRDVKPELSAQIDAFQGALPTNYQHAKGTSINALG